MREARRYRGICKTSTNLSRSLASSIRRWGLVNQLGMLDDFHEQPEGEHTSCARIAIPMPDATKLCASFEDLAFVTQLSKLVHQINTAKPSTNDEDFSLQFLCIILIVGGGVLIGRANVCPHVNHSGGR
jgi:hypothetical protein